MPNTRKVQSKRRWSRGQESLLTVCAGSRRHHRLCDPWPVLLQADSSCHVLHNAKTGKPTTAIRSAINKMAYHHFLCPDCWWQMRDDPVGNSVSQSKVRGTRSLLSAPPRPRHQPLIHLFYIRSPRSPSSLALKTFSLHLQHICNNQYELRGCRNTPTLIDF